MFMVIISDCDDGMRFHLYETLEEAKEQIENASYCEDREYWLAEMIGKYVPVPNITWQVVPENDTKNTHA